VESALYHHRPLEPGIINQEVVCAVHIAQHYAWMLTKQPIVTEFFEETFDILGTGGEKITVPGADMSRGILVVREDGSAGVVWDKATGYQNINNLLRIRLVEKQAKAEASGPVLAAYQAIDMLSPIRMKLEDYSIRSVTEGQDAQGQVSVKVSSGNRTISGQGLSYDILESSILAYINALNKLLRPDEPKEPPTGIDRS
jgi:hypothetical protein